MGFRWTTGSIERLCGVVGGENHHVNNDRARLPERARERERGGKRENEGEGERERGRDMATEK